MLTLYARIRNLTLVEAMFIGVSLGVIWLMGVWFLDLAQAEPQEETPVTQVAEQLLTRMGIVERGPVLCDDHAIAGDFYRPCSYQAGGQVQFMECRNWPSEGCRAPKGRR